MSVADSEIKGRLLIASPVLGDPNFHRTVVFMIEHTAAAGALGVVLNRPSEQRVSEAIPGWEGLAAAPGVVFSGGPVEGGRVLCLGRSKPGPDRAAEDALEEPPAGPARCRGRSVGWNPGSRVPPGPGSLFFTLWSGKKGRWF